MMAGARLTPVASLLLSLSRSIEKDGKLSTLKRTSSKLVSPHIWEPHAAAEQDLGLAHFHSVAQ